MRVHGVCMAASLLGAALGLGGCGSRARVVDPATELHLSGSWNDADSRAVVEALGPQLTSGPWIERLGAALGRPPVVRVVHVRHRTSDLDDPIDTRLMAADLERALLATGRVRVVADRDEAGRSREERRDVAAHAEGGAPAAPQGREQAPDLLLAGIVRSQHDAVAERGALGTGAFRRVRFYKAEFSLLHAESGEVVWTGSAERKKVEEQSRLSW